MPDDQFNQIINIEITEDDSQVRRTTQAILEQQAAATELGVRGTAAFNELEGAMARAGATLSSAMSEPAAAAQVAASTIVAAQERALSRAALYQQYPTASEMRYIQELERKAYPPPVAYGRRDGVHCRTRKAS